MNSAERKRKSREKLKSDEEKRQEFLKKERERDAERRKKKKELAAQNEEVKAVLREKERLRKKKAREMKKMANAPIPNSLSSPLGSYKTVRTLRKAVIKTQKSLPESPMKKQAVLMELLKNAPKPPILLEHTSKIKRIVISEEEKKEAKRFYERDDISRAAPGRKDTISVKNKETGTRTHVAKRHMVMSVAEAYALFNEKYPSSKIGKSIFYELRPVHVRPMSEMPHNVCVCMHHANYTYLVEAMHKVCVIFPAKPTELLEKMCCDCTNEPCMMSTCEKCFDITDLVPEKFDKNTKVSWKQWTKSDNRLQVTILSGTANELVQELKNQTPKFKLHVFVKRRQSENFQTQKMQTTNEEVLLQVDFAENFAILSQDEIQSAHWSHPQVTIFTGCAWAAQGEDKISYLILSNELSHDKYAVWAFLKKIIDDLKTEYPTLKKIYMFSDGCAAQFKNRYTLSNICWSQEDWGVEVEWNFFATSHGKGAMDGVGATAKKALWDAIMTRRQIINTSWDCFDYLKSKQLKGMRIHFVAVDDIYTNKEKLDDRWFTIRSIPYIQKQHYFKALSNKCLAYALTATSHQQKILLSQEGQLSYGDVYSDSESEETTSRKMDVDNVGRSPEPRLQNSITETHSGIDVRTGQYLLVKLETTMGRKQSVFKYLAVSQSCVDDDDEIKVMFLKSLDKTKKTFRIDENDVSYIKKFQILDILPEPTMKTTGDRLFYEFDSSVDVLEKK